MGFGMDFAHYNDSVDISTLREYFDLNNVELVIHSKFRAKGYPWFIEGVRKEIESAIEDLIEKYGS